MASHVASADDADALGLRNKAVAEFASVIATLDGIELDQSEGDALKKMKRGASLHLFERVALGLIQLDAVERRDDGCEFGDGFVAQR